MYTSQQICGSKTTEDFRIWTIYDNKLPLSYPMVLKTYMSLVMRKPAFCICENKDADQLRSNCTADQRLCFRYIDSRPTIPLLPRSEILSLKPSGLCRTWSNTPKTGSLATRLTYELHSLLLRGDSEDTN